MAHLQTFFATFIFLNILAPLCHQAKLSAEGHRWWTWYFPDGSVDKAGTDPKVMWNKYGLPNDMTGKKFYDLGCWDGGTCFEAALRGADEIYGLDSFVWEVDPGNYKNFCYARDRIAPHVKDVVVEIEPIPQSKFFEGNRLQSKHTIESFADEYGTADVVLAAGILYHLVDPIKFLKDLKLLVTPNTGRVYITTWCTREKGAVANFVPGWRGDDTNFWVLSINCMIKLLNQMGYEIENMQVAIEHKEPLICFKCRVPE